MRHLSQRIARWCRTAYIVDASGKPLEPRSAFPYVRPAASCPELPGTRYPAGSLLFRSSFMRRYPTIFLTMRPTSSLSGRFPSSRPVARVKANFAAASASATIRSASSAAVSSWGPRAPIGARRKVFGQQIPEVRHEAERAHPKNRRMRAGVCETSRHRIAAMSLARSSARTTSRKSANVTENGVLEAWLSYAARTASTSSGAAGMPDDGCVFGGESS